MRSFADKPDEREFTEQDVYVNNDSHSVQRRARIAMFVLNGLLLVMLSFAVRCAFGPGVALATLLFLAIDPTVAAHLPVVMTDLPVALLSSTTLLLAIVAFQNWSPWNLSACSAALGLSLATKHSAPIFAVVLVWLAPFSVVLPLAEIFPPHTIRQAFRSCRWRADRPVGLILLPICRKRQRP
jgi:predicted membrane-bound mannosyltransferase